MPYFWQFYDLLMKFEFSGLEHDLDIDGVLWLRMIRPIRGRSRR
jgi:hypothetical protein